MRASARVWLSDLKYRAALAKAHLLIHSAPARHWRNLSWPLAGPADGVQTIYSDRYDVFGANQVAMIRDERARKCFEEENRRWQFQEDVIYRVEGDISVEPRFSLAFLPGRRLLDPLRGVHREIFPSLVRTTLRNVVGAPVRRFDALLHFDGFLGKNLWHFFDDAFNAMFLIDKSGLVPADTPILIHQRIWDMPLAQLVLGRPPFADRQWIVQDERTWIKTNVLYKALCTRAYFADSYAFLDNHRKNPSRRIFLNRRARYRRGLSNSAEIEKILLEYGFESIFAEDLPYLEQVELFSQVKIIVGIHGAGLTNLLFSDLPSVRCLEILPDGYVYPHYYWMLQVAGAEKYDAIVGSKLDAGHNFSVDPAAFRVQLEHLLS